MPSEIVDPEFAALAGKVDFPPRLFLYTLDQVATCLEVDVKDLRKRYVFFRGRSSGPSPRSMILAINIAGPDDPPAWRVAENELVRWMKSKGFVFSTSNRLIR